MLPVPCCRAVANKLPLGPAMHAKLQADHMAVCTVIWQCSGDHQVPLPLQAAPAARLHALASLMRQSTAAAGAELQRTLPAITFIASQLQAMGPLAEQATAGPMAGSADASAAQVHSHAIQASQHELLQQAAVQLQAVSAARGERPAQKRVRKALRAAQEGLAAILGSLQQLMAPAMHLQVRLWLVYTWYCRHLRQPAGQTTSWRCAMCNAGSHSSSPVPRTCGMSISVCAASHACVLKGKSHVIWSLSCRGRVQLPPGPALGSGWGLHGCLCAAPDSHPLLQALVRLAQTPPASLQKRALWLLSGAVSRPQPGPSTGSDPAAAQAAFSLLDQTQDLSTGGASPAGITPIACVQVCDVAAPCSLSDVAMVWHGLRWAGSTAHTQIWECLPYMTYT